MKRKGIRERMEKVEKEKNAEKGKIPDDPNCNIPLHPTEGSRPYEKEPEKVKDAKDK